MFDAAAGATADQAADLVAEQQAEASDDANPESSIEQEASDLSYLANIPEYSAQTQEVAFVDADVENLDQLLAGMDPSVEIVMLDAAKDGVEQIAAALAGRSELDAVHIISHGEQGRLFLGNTALDASSMQGAHQDALASLRDALSDNGDILIYGCDFAGGEAGVEAANLLGSITGADIAASSDDTGHITRGGDWDLEMEIGAIETEAIAAVEWQGLLAEVVNTSGPQTGSYTATGSGEVTITIRGGDGGNEDRGTGGAGATVTATFRVNAGDVIRYVVGEAGQSNVSDEAGGGGSTGVFINNTLVLVAGGGGGAEDNNGDGQGGQATQDGGDGTGTTGPGNSGGTNGNGGNSDTSAGAGGGIFSDGQGPGSTAGLAADLIPGDGVTLIAGGTGSAAGGRGFTSGGSGTGGEAGGGGGYSGGGSGAGNNSGGGGGGSFVHASALSSTISAGGDGAGTQADGSIQINFEIDTDGDSILDINDIDDDNDGILDVDETDFTAGGTITTPIFGVPENGGTSLQAIDLSGLGAWIGSTVTISNVTANGDLNGGGTEVFTLDFNSGEYVTAGLDTGFQSDGIQHAVNPSVTQTVSVIDIGGGIPGISIQATTGATVDDLNGMTVGVEYQLQIDLAAGSSTRDSDGDGIADHLDIDSDNDGITDNVEAQSTANYIAPSGTGGAMLDVNADGLDDRYDDTQAGVGSNAAGTYTHVGTGLAPVNSDGSLASADGLADYRDADSDNDGIDDIAERGDGAPTSITSTTDSDGDGLLDIFEGTNVTDGFDVNDENRDATSIALSGDPLLAIDGSNATAIVIDSNFRDADTDNDAVVDSLDIDDDNDGILDTDEQTLIVSAPVTTSLSYDPVASAAAGQVNGQPVIILTDGTITVRVENNLGATISGDRVTTDNSSGTTESVRITATAPMGTVLIDGLEFTDLDNFDPDSFVDALALDRTGTWSGLTNTNGIDALVAFTNDAAGEAAATIATGETVDLSDARAAGAVSDFLINPASTVEDNYRATFTFDTAASTFLLFGTDAVPAFNQVTSFTFNTLPITYRVETYQARDSDGDGIADHLDIDSDNDGITDNVEAQSTANYIAPSGTGGAMLDVNADGLDDRYDDTQAGVGSNAAGTYTHVGTGLAPVDTDGDLTADHLDADSDNDLALDIAERGDGAPTSITSTVDSDGDGLLDIFEGGAALDGFDVNDENLTGSNFIFRACQA